MNASSLSLHSGESWTPRPLDPRLKSYHPQHVSVPVDAGYRDSNGHIRIGGSDHGGFVLGKVNALFEDFHPGLKLTLDLKGTPTAVAFLIHGKVLFSVMGREVTPVERVPFEKAVGAPAIAIHLAHTAADKSQHLATSLAVYVHRDNPVTRLTTQQISQIFTIGHPHGDFSRWGQLGLVGAWAKRRIHPIGTPEYSGFGTYMQAHHLDHRAMSPVYETYVGTDAVLGRLADDPAGIAVAAIGRETDRIKALPVARTNDGLYLTGTAEDVATNSYAFGRFLYAYVAQKPGKPADPVLIEYLRLILSHEGQSIIASQPRGYIPLTAPEVANERAKLDALSTQI